MAVRTIVITDDQLELISAALDFLIINHPSTQRTANVLEEASMLKACCDQTRKEPDDRNMIHGFAL
jgi:hypothetical protein